MERSRRVDRSRLGLNNGYFPDWFLTEVFNRLPVKSIFRLKCVSKQWLSVISDPSFARLYVSSRISSSSSQPQPWTLLSCHMHVVEEGSQISTPPGYRFLQNVSSDDYEFPRFSVVDFPHPQQPMLGQDYTILALSNGLLLCRRRIRRESRHYHICNPVTRQWVILPPPTRRFKWASEGFITMVEGGVATSYKVVRLDRPLEMTHVLNFEVFSSETGEWTDFNVYYSWPVEFVPRGPPVAFNGILHWFDRLHGIIAYDPYKNPSDCRLITLPGDRDMECDNRVYNGITRLCDVHRGHLRYFELFGVIHPSNFVGLSVWTLKDYDRDVWSLEHRVLHDDISYGADLAIHLSRTVPTSIAFHPFDSDIVYLGVDNIIVSYNISSKTMEVQGDPISFESKLYWFWVFPYVLPLWPTAVPQAN